MDATRIIAIRHGETAWNVDSRLQGHLDIPLNDVGLWQARQAALALAEQALARAGLQRNDDSGQWVVQLGAQAGFTPRRDPFDDYPPWAFGGWGWYGGRGGWGMSGLWQVGAPAPLHRRVVSIVMRDARTQEVVYETSAVHEDVWVSDPAVYGVLFDAALNGFPQPPQGPRQVRIPLPTQP